MIIYSVRKIKAIITFRKVCFTQIFLRSIKSRNFPSKPITADKAQVEAQS